MGGLSTDLVIEQVLMRSIKSTGGLTRGRGLGSTQRTLWLLSMPACSEVHEAMQNLTATQYHSNKEHVEASNSRKVRDSKDITEIEDFLSEILKPVPQLMHMSTQMMQKWLEKK